MSGGISRVEVDDGGGELVELGLAVGVDGGLPGVEQHLGLEHEAVAHDPDLRPIAEDLAQTAEEVGAVARQLLHLLGERHVQARAEVGDPGLAVLVALLGGAERVFERGELPAQRGDLLVQHVDLGQRARRRLLLGHAS